MGEAYVSVGRKTRFPTLKEMYSTQNDMVFPNDSLKAENSINLETGFRLLPDRIDWVRKLDISLFVNYLENLIDKVYIDNVSKWDQYCFSKILWI